jgi:hypothetical protein
VDRVVRGHRSAVQLRRAPRGEAERSPYTIRCSKHTPPAPTAIEQEAAGADGADAGWKELKLC